MNTAKYIDRPNLLRVATEIAESNNPDQVLETMKSVLKCGFNDFADANQNICLLFGEIIAVSDESL